LDFQDRIEEGTLAMAQSKSLPDPVLVVRTYQELERYARAFADGHLNLVLIYGDPGLGKSRCVRQAIGDNACRIDGTATAFGIYLEAYEHRNQPMVLDDVDGLYRDRNGIRLLKALCQTDPVKYLSWQTDSKTLQRRGIPQQFTTTSRVVIIANQWKSLNVDVAALEDRGHLLHFAPAPIEVHHHAAQWFWDQAIFDFVAAHLYLMKSHSLRTYVLAWELKKAGLDWQQGVLGRCLTGVAREVAKFKADPSFASEEDRVRAFVAAGGGCRATYFNHAKKLQPRADVPQLQLIHSAPSANVPVDESFLEKLRRRFGHLGNG
jgi:hypothetical protein